MDFLELMEVAEPIIRANARRLARAPGFTRTDIPDIEQSIRAHLIRVSPRCDDRRRPAAFIEVVMENCVRSMQRHRSAQARSPFREAYSLDDARYERSQNVSPARKALVVDVLADDRRIDMQPVLARLTDGQRVIVGAVADGSVRSASRQLKLSRRRVTDELVAVRRIFEDAGLAIYLPRARQTASGVEDE